MRVGDVAVVRQWIYGHRSSKKWCRLDPGAVLIIVSIKPSEFDADIVLVKAIEVDNVYTIKVAKGDASFFFNVIGSAQSE